MYKKSVKEKEPFQMTTRSSSGCKLIYIFKHSIMIFHRHKMFIVPLLSLSLLLTLSQSSCEFMVPWKLNQVALFNQSLSLFNEFYFYCSRIVVIKKYIHKKLFFVWLLLLLLLTLDDIIIEDFFSLSSLISHRGVELCMFVF